MFKFDADKLKAFAAGTQEQKVVKGTSKSRDAKFPVFGSPTGGDYLFYIPRVDVVKTEEGEKFNVLRSVIHGYNYMNGSSKRFGEIRCIKGLQGEVFEELGYDGDCPICEAQQDCWKLYNMKIDVKAKELGLSKGEDGKWDDPDDKLSTFKSEFSKEMAIQSPSEYITFPIVVIPKKANASRPADDAANDLKVYWLHWRVERYNDKFIQPLGSLDENPGHPAGLVWLVRYGSGEGTGKVAKMQAARNVNVSICQNQGVFKDIIPLCEEAAKEFTSVKALETIYATEIRSKKETEDLVETIMKDTRLKINLYSEESEGQKAIESNAEQALKEFNVGQALEEFNISDDESLGLEEEKEAGPVSFDN